MTLVAHVLTIVIISIIHSYAADVIKGVAYVGRSKNGCRGVDVVLRKDEQQVGEVSTAQDGSYEFRNVEPDSSYRIEYEKTGSIIIVSRVDLITKHGDTTAPHVEVFPSAVDVQQRDLEAILKERAVVVGNAGLINADLEALKEAGLDSHLLAGTARSFDAMATGIPAISIEDLERAFGGSQIVIVKGKEVITFASGKPLSDTFQRWSDLGKTLPKDKKVVVVAADSEKPFLSSSSTALAIKELGYDNVQTLKQTDAHKFEFQELK
jgi:hypothetical protein